MAIPVPKRSSGFTLGDKTADVKIEIFFDIQCPHSKRAWPVLIALLEHYQEQSVSVTAQLITLSNHRQAWDMSLGLFAVAQGDAQRFFDFASFLFERQEHFLNAPFQHKTHQQLRELVVDYAQQHSNCDPKSMMALLDNHDIYIAARTPIRYAATKSVWATPTFFINNGDDVPVSFDSSLEHWISEIDALLA